VTALAALPRADARLHLLDSVFGGGHRRTHVVEPGQSLVAALRRHWPDEWDGERPPPLVLVHNGQVVTDISIILQPGDHLAVYPRTADPVSIGATVAAAVGATGGAAAVISGVVAVGIVVGVSYAASALLAPDAPDVPQGQNSRPHYAWDGVTTEYRGYGAQIPCVYGEQIVGGTVISYSVHTRGNKSILRLLLVLSHGPVESIAGVARTLDGESGAAFTSTDFRLNGTPVKDWGDLARVWTRLGGIDQTAIPGMNDEERTYQVGLRVKKSDPVEYRTRTPVNALNLRFTFTQGLVWIDNRGEYLLEGVKFRARYRRADLPETDASWSAWDQWQFTGKQTDPLPRDHYIEFPELRSYVIHIERLTDEPVTTEGVSSRSRVELSQVVEVVARDLQYPGLALCGLEVTSVDGLSGPRPSTEIPIRGIQALIPDEDDQDATAHTRAWTRSPFWVVYDLLRNAEYGLGDATRYMRYDIAEWRAASEHAAELVAAGHETTTALSATSGSDELRVADTEGFVAGDQAKLEIDAAGEELVEIREVLDDVRLRLTAPLAASHAKGVTLTKVHARYEWDGVLDGSGSPWDTVQQILATARARLVKQGNDFILVRAVPRDPVMLICEGNGAADFVETRQNARMQPNALDLQFWNRADRFQRDNRLVMAEDAVLDQVSDATFYARESIRPKEEQAFGITRAEQIERHGRFRLRQLRQAPRGWACTLPLEALVAPVGSVVEVAHRVVLATTWSGRTTAAAASGTSTIRLDQPVVLAPSTTYAVRVRVGTSVLATRQITSAAGSYARGDALSISGTWPDDVDAGAPYALGLQGQETVPAEVVAYALLEDFRVAIVTQEHVEANLADV
jgi:hypothetical protein